MMVNCGFTGEVLGTCKQSISHHCILSVFIPEFSDSREALLILGPTNTVLHFMSKL